jgi:arylsulfatase A-like enzyme
MRLAAILALGLLAPGVASAADAKPNVLFIAVDDLNAWIGCMGVRPDVKTPNIDRLAARGTLFTRAYCVAPACNPSRAALLTGVRPSTSGVYHNSQPWRPVLKDAVTLPQHFQANGYKVEGGGKIFHGGFNDQASWENYHKERGGNPTPPNKPVNGLNMAQFDWGPLNVADDAMPDHKTVTWASEFLQKKYDRPFFLAVGLHKPHLPFYAPKKYFDLYPLDKIELPKTLETDLDDVPPVGVKVARPTGDHAAVLKANQWKQAVQAYLACISYADAEIGRLLDALDKSPHAANTIIVFWGDHGWHLGEKQHWRKFALWEEATRTPLIVVAPGVSKEKQRCDRPVTLMDIYPTLVDLCALKEKPGLEAHSLLPLLKDAKAEWKHAAITTHGRENHAVRTDRWRYIRYSDGGEELYDHTADPLEWKNLAKDPKFDAVKKELAAHLPKVNAPDAPAQKAKPE